MLGCVRYRSESGFAETNTWSGQGWYRLFPGTDTKTTGASVCQTGFLGVIPVRLNELINPAIAVALRVAACIG